MTATTTNFPKEPDLLDSDGALAAADSEDAKESELLEKLQERINEGDDYARRLEEAVRTWQSLDESPQNLLDLNDTVLLTTETPATVPWPTRQPPPAPQPALAELLEVLPDAIMLLDADGRIKYWSAAAEELFGWSASEVIGMPPPFVDGAHAAEHAEILEATRRDSPIRERIVSRRGRDGCAHPLRLFSSLTLAGDVAMVFRAVETVPVFKPEATSPKFEMLGRMVAGVAHDFNNVLSAIVGSADLLADRINVHSADREWVEVIRTAGRHATGLTRRLMHFARPSPMAPVSTDLSQVVEELLPLVSALVPNGVRVKASVEDDLPEIAVEATVVEQVLLNLAVNAGQAMPRGGALNIRTSQEARGDQNYLVLAVSDSGIGMDEETKVRLFEPFYSTKPAGIGLGLTGVRELVTQAGGFIEVDSITHLGSVFRVFLPARAKRSMLLDGRGRTALVADDDPGVRDVVKRVLESVGFTVCEAASGDEALDSARWMPDDFDLLVTDVVMPGLGGRKLAAQLRSQHNDLAVVYVSGYPRVEEVLLPSTHFLAKPFLPKQLLAAVQTVLPVAAPG